MGAAPLVPRHYIIMEVKQNLVAEDRKMNLQRFNQPHFKKIAKVVMGEPTADYKERVHADLLKDKQHQTDAEWNKKKVEQEKRRAIKKRKAEAEEKKRIAMEEAKKRKEAADAKRKELEEKKKAEAEAKKKEEGKDADDKK